MKNKNTIVLFSIFTLLAALSACTAIAQNQTFPAFPTFPSVYPTEIPRLPTPFPMPFPTSTPVPSPTVIPTATPSPTPVPTATNLYGTIQDKNGTALPNIYAIVLNQSGPMYSSTSDSNGYYMICHVPFGNYTVDYIRNNTTAYSTKIVLNRSTQKMNTTIPG
jgi:hypothetical protein